MNKPLLTTLLFLSIFSSAFASDSLVVTRSVYFDVDAAQLDADARQRLDSVVRSIRDEGECTVSIYGSTDVDGAAGYNQQLSERRARSVQDYLLARNIRATQYVTLGRGKNGNQQSKKENRRVDVILKFTYFSNVADLYEALGKGSDQQYTIDADKPGRIRCKNNSIIEIPAGSLMTADGKRAKGKITITVREALHTEDILSQDLNSISDERMLETGGMLYISAGSGGQTLTLDSTRPMSVSIPALNTSKGMKLFYGERKANQPMNWMVDKADFKPNVKIVPMDIDRSMLQSMIKKQGKAPALPKAENDASIPMMPVKPRKPIAIKKPQQENSYKGTALEKAFDKKKISEKNEEIYKEALEKYKDLQEKECNYQAKMREYEKSIKDYNEKMKGFKAEGEKRQEIARRYFKELYMFSAIGSINTMIRTVLDAKLDNTTRMTGFMDIRVSSSHPTDQHQQLRQIIGDTYFHYYHYDDAGVNIVDIDNTIHADSLSRIFQVQGYQAIYDSLMAASHMHDTLMKLQERITARCAQLGLFTKQDATAYISAVSQLGWINCDRFTETPPAQLVKLKVEETDDVKMYMVFSDIKSCLPISRSDGRYESSLVPRGKNVRIVAVKVRDGKPQLAVSRINTSTRDPLKLQYKTCSLADIKNSFAAL